jgi:hypothetical protein
MRKILLGGVVLALAAASPAEHHESIRHVIVYRLPGRYGGWPANHGIWHWGDEILVGFEAGYFKYNDSRHSIDWDRPPNISSHVAWTAVRPGMSKSPRA